MYFIVVGDNLRAKSVWQNVTDLIMIYIKECLNSEQDQIIFFFEKLEMILHKIEGRKEPVSVFSVSGQSQCIASQAIAASVHSGCGTIVLC